MAACKHIVTRALSDIRCGTTRNPPLYQFLIEHPDCVAEAEYIVHTIRDNSSDGKREHNELRHQLLDDGRNVLSCFDKDATPVIR